MFVGVDQNRVITRSAYPLRQSLNGLKEGSGTLYAVHWSRSPLLSHLLSGCATECPRKDHLSRLWLATISKTTSIECDVWQSHKAVGSEIDVRVANHAFGHQRRQRQHY